MGTRRSIACNENAFIASRRPRATTSNVATMPIDGQAIDNTVAAMTSQGVGATAVSAYPATLITPTTRSVRVGPHLSEARPPG